MFNIGINKILLAIIIILLIVLGFIVYWQKSGFEKSYWAVYLDTGDLYFGKLSYFPKLSLSEVLLIQRNPQDTQNPLSLARFREAFWGPEDKIYLNERSIVWKAKLEKNSKVLDSIRNFQGVKTQIQTQNQAQDQLNNQQSITTSSPAL